LAFFPEETGPAKTLVASAAVARIVMSDFIVVEEGYRGGLSPLDYTVEVVKAS
jgi:hypothetical protein